jgi:hypothetical protein
MFTVNTESAQRRNVWILFQKFYKYFTLNSKLRISSSSLPSWEAATVLFACWSNQHVLPSTIFGHPAQGNLSVRFAIVQMQLCQPKTNDTTVNQKQLK